MGWKERLWSCHVSVVLCVTLNLLFGRRRLLIGDRNGRKDYNPDWWRTCLSCPLSQRALANQHGSSFIYKYQCIVCIKTHIQGRIAANRHQHDGIHSRIDFQVPWTYSLKQNRWRRHLTSPSPPQGSLSTSSIQAIIAASSPTEG